MGLGCSGLGVVGSWREGLTDVAGVFSDSVEDDGGVIFGFLGTETTQKQKDDKFM